MKERLLKLLKTRRPDAYAGIDPETITLEEIMALLEAEEAEETPSSEAAEALQEARQIVSGLAIREELADSRLPDLAQRRIRERFEGQVVTRAQIQEAVTAERDYLSQLAPARISGLGGSRDVTVGASKLDRLQAAVDRAFGLEIEDPALRTVKPIGLRQLYQEITLGGDPEVTGVLQESVQREMLREAFDSTTLPRVMSNAMNRRLTRDYNEVDYGERRIISVVSASDFRTREAIRVGYFGDISTVNPETGDYQELAAYGEESAQYAVGQKGNLVTITRKHIINDDIGAVAKVVGRMGRAARRTFAKFVWKFIKDNPQIYTTKTFFHATQGNLLTDPLSVAALNKARLALANQTEPGSGEKLGLKPALLAIPAELLAVAYTINQSQQVPGSANNDANPWYHAFGAGNENILENALFDDADDWVLFGPNSDVDIIEVAFLHGQEEPELFTADNPTVGQMFTADKLQYKIRHEYGGAVVDYRGAVKSVVPEAEPEA